MLSRIDRDGRMLRLSKEVDALKKAVAEADYVIHAAALADVAACTRKPMAAIHTNITGTQVLLDAVAACERIRRLVFVSSASVYGNGDPEDWARPCQEFRTVRKLLEAVYGRVPPQFHEHTQLRPMSVYANTKAWGETQTALTLGAVGTSYTVVRYFSVYGDPQVVKENSHSWVVAWFATRAALGLPLHLNGCGHQIRDLVHVDDIAAATVRALVAPRAHNETINIGTGAPPASARWPTWSPSSTRGPGSWRRRCRPVTRSAATRPPTAWKQFSAGSRRSPSRRGWPATRTGWTRPRRQSPRGCGASPKPRRPDQMTGGRPSRVIRHTVDHRIGRRGGHEVRRPSANPPNQARSPAADRVRATVSAVQRPR